MLQLYLENVLRIFGDLLYVEQHSRALRDEKADVIMDEQVTKIVTDYVQSTHGLCENMKLKAAEKQAQRILAGLDGGQLTRQDFLSMVSELRSRIEDEASLMLFLYIDKTDFYEKAELFGPTVDTHFPATTIDIEEAGNCIAVGRPTACVFHLLRVVEVGVKAFGTALGISAKLKTAQPSWGDVLRETWNEIQTKNKSGDPTWTADKRKFFENVQSDLQIVKTAWRNPTMHVENIYDDDRAEDIFNSVKSWMRHLAKHLDESGNYTP